MKRAVLVATLLAAACIERPPSPRAAAAAVDRSSLADVVSQKEPTPAHKVGAVFGGAIELVGYDLSPEPAARGSTVTVTFWWRSRAPVNDDWQVFVHVDDESRTVGRIIGDHFPAQGRYRTPAWRAGDVVKDQWRFAAPAGTDELALFVGFYRGETRLEVSDPGLVFHDGVNRIRAGVITLR